MKTAAAFKLDWKIRLLGLLAMTSELDVCSAPRKEEPDVDMDETVLLALCFAGANRWIMQMTLASITSRLISVRTA